MSGFDEAALVAAARAARAYAAAPFSGFHVGAALVTASGAVFTGCNVESASYGLTMCAERVALFTALSQGHRRFSAVAVAADSALPTPPCGACRQLLWEYAGDIHVILTGPDEVVARHRLAALLPHPFDAGLFGREEPG